ncbi:MAG: hypothetical protein KF901_13120 [Myxococcales bacterium]|nr:hypothetical protein [Myxococcales bacterium]
MAALGAAVIAGGAAAFGAGFDARDQEWAYGVYALAVVLVVVAGAAWRGARAAAPIAMGAALFSAGFWLESLIALGPFAEPGPARDLSVKMSSLGIAASLLAVALAGPATRTLPWRNAAALVFSGMALLPATLFAFALEPRSDMVPSVIVIAGACLVVCGAAVVARGRTAGLFVGLLGAIGLAFGVALAPTVVYFGQPHPWLPNGNAFFASVLGASAVIAAALPVVLYLGPIARFLRPSSPIP